MALQQRRNATDYHSLGVPKDHFHSKLPHQLVGTTPANAFAFYFHAEQKTPQAQASIGVALCRCEYGGDGVELKQSALSSLMSPRVTAQNANGSWLAIHWPGYEHHSFMQQINLNTTIGGLASQVAKAFRIFYEKHHREFLGPGIRLGPSYVTFDHIRVRKLYWDGLVWNMETSYVYEGKPRWDAF